jgi:hypothetical protein
MQTKKFVFKTGRFKQLFQSAAQKEIKENFQQIILFQELYYGFLNCI